MALLLFVNGLLLLGATALLALLFLLQLGGLVSSLLLQLGFEGLLFLILPALDFLHPSGELRIIVGKLAVGGHN